MYSGAALQSFIPQDVGVSVSNRFLGVDIDRHLEQIVGSGINPITHGRIERLPISSAWLIHGPKPGPVVAITGGIHGLETCGVEAVSQLLKEFTTGERELSRGSLILAIGNERALNACKRQEVTNLNRILLNSTVPNPEMGVYETQRAVELRDHILSRADAYLDLHSTSAATVPFGIVPEYSLDLVRDLGLGAALVTPPADWGMGGLFAGTASQFVIERQKRFAITVENGQHAAPNSAVHAYDISLRFLISTGFLRGDVMPAKEVFCVRPFLIQKKLRDDFVFDGSFENFDALKSGQLIGHDGTQEFRAPKDCHIILPTPPQQSKVGVEVYLLGEGWVQR